MALVATALISWLFVLPQQIRGHADNPYVGIVVFLVIPAIFFTGLLLIPVGVYLSKRQIRGELAEETFDRRLALRRLAWFFGATTLLNILIGTQSHLSGNRAHGDTTILWRDLSHDEPGASRLSEFTSLPGRMRRVSCGARCSRLGQPARQAELVSSSRRCSIAIPGQFLLLWKAIALYPPEKPARNATGRGSSVVCVCAYSASMPTTKQTHDRTPFF